MRSALLAMVAMMSGGATFGGEVGNVADVSLPVIETIQEHYAAYEIDGVRLSDNSIRITISTHAGVPVFESRYPVVKADGTFLEWTYSAEPRYAVSTRIEKGMYPTLTKMTYAGKAIVRMIRRGTTLDAKTGSTGARGLKVETNDNYGCDFPFELLSCGERGNCCDTHDACFNEWACSAFSWIGIGSAECVECSRLAEACILAGTGSTGEPSVCCAAHNCGQTRPVTQSAGGGVHHVPSYAPDPGLGGGYGDWNSTPWGDVQISYGSGTCHFANGVVLPCG